jgi:hypothetical protein
MFALEHFVVIPLLFSPIWGLQTLLLWNVSRGRQWSRLLLLASTFCLIAFLVVDPPNHLALLINVAPVAVQLVGLAMLLFARTSDDW